MHKALEVCRKESLRPRVKWETKINPADVFKIAAAFFKPRFWKTSGKTDIETHDTTVYRYYLYLISVWVFYVRITDIFKTLGFYLLSCHVTQNVPTLAKKRKKIILREG